MQDKKEPIIEAIWALMSVYQISIPEVEDFRGRKIYEDMVQQDPIETEWIEKNVKPRNKIEVKDASSSTE